MKREWGEICAIVAARRTNDSALKKAMIEVRDRANGDYVLPLYDVDGEPIVSSMSPQLIANAIESTAQRAGQPTPRIVVPSIDEKRSSQKKANTTRRALQAVWSHEANNLDLGINRAYRHLVGYGTMAIMVSPDFEDECVQVGVRDPLTMYPEPRAPEDIRAPYDVAFIYGRSASWLADNYPYAVDGTDLRDSWRMAMQSRNDFFELVEWVDEDSIVIGVLSSPGRNWSDPGLQIIAANGIELSRSDNKAGMVPATVGQIVTIDKIASAVSRIVGTTDMLDRMTALQTIAAERSVFPDRYVIGKDGRPPMIMGGEWQDGRTGRINQVLDATSIGELVTPMGPAVQPVISNLERAARLSGADPAVFGGEMNGSVRSGQTITQLGAFSVDPGIAEYQKIMAANLKVVNRAIINVAKGYFGSKTFSMYSGRGADRTIVEFTPNEDFVSDKTYVSYAMPGMDVSQTTVAIGQLVGTGLMSKATGRAQHPLIEDDNYEESQLEREQLHDAMMASIAMQAQQGTIPPVDIARILQLSLEGEELPKAILKVQQEAQARQAATAAPPAPGQGAAPATMPGLSQPGMGVESQPPEQIARPDQSLGNLKQLLSNLNAHSTVA